MSDIQLCSTQIFHWDTTSSPGNYTQTLNLSFVPDVAIIRQITYYDVQPNLSKGHYFIWSSMKGDYIGSFTVMQGSSPAGSDVGQSAFVSNPQTVITGIQSMSNSITFQIQRQTAGAFVAQTALSGAISVQIDFLKFRC